MTKELSDSNSVRYIEPMAQSTREPQDKLEARTKEYWKLIEKLDSPDKLLDTLKWYIDHLLPLEMTWIRPASLAPPKPYHTLALLVGYSLEPLLQAICFYQPSRVVLVLSENYGRETGDVMGGHIEKLVKQLMQSRGAEPPLLETAPTIGPKDHKGYFREVKSDPAHVFQILLNELLAESPEKIVVDITGARKSMMAGAFFYAAFADVTISYVEFDDTNYNLTLGRPEGYRSVIRRLPNPYATFALREWVHIRHLYTHYDFRSARETLTRDVLPIMAQPAPDSDKPFFAPNQIQAAKQLIKILEFYERWDVGDFGHAAAKPTLLPATKQPLAVRKLTDLLPTQLDRKDGERAADQLVSHLNQQMRLGDNDRSFLLRPQMLGIYAADEVARIGRLIDFHKDYRSALMRATGLYELLLHARILTLWRLGHLEYRTDNGSTWQPLTVDLPDWREQYEPLVNEMRGLDQYRDFAYKRDAYRIKSTFTHVRWPDDTSWEIPGCARLSSPIKELRHKTTHRAVPVPEKTARLALEAVQASFADYCERWAPQLEPGFNIPAPDEPIYQAQPWSKICEWCGLNEVLTPNLLRDEGR